jgi:hypothetical protein
MSVILRLEKVRVSFAEQIYTPKAFEDGVAKYGCDSLMVEGSRVMKKISAGKWVETDIPTVMLDLANELFKGKGAPWLKALEPSKKFYRDGDLRLTKGGEPYAEYVGIHYVTAKNKIKPKTIDNLKNEIGPESGKPYSGCYCNVQIDVYGIADPKKKGIHATLLGVQYLHDGDAFGGGSRTADLDDFESISEGADADLL